LRQMMKGIAVGVTWGPRPEPLGQCASRAWDCFSRLAELSEIFAQWFERANRPTLERAVHWDNKSELERLLQKGIQCSDHSQVTLPDLGYSLGAWNGNYRREGAGISIHCGSFSNYVNNRVIIDLLASEDGFPKPEFILHTLEALVMAWDPDMGEAFQLVTRGEDFEELYCAGYSLNRVSRGNVQAQKCQRGTIWFDQVTYDQFV
jgi:Immunity protein 52